MADVGTAIMRFAKHIPDGVVVFFPSYSYLDTCIAAWKRLRPAGQASSASIWDTIQEVKPVFLEQRKQQAAPTPDNPSKEAALDSVLASYSAAIASSSSPPGRGALLLAVINGSLSEGINFSDSLGRGVMVVGLPFPNPHSAEWKAKTQYISSKASARGQNGKVAAREYYENVCMRAVNQCVGRAIRHKGDYASIVLLDKRYAGKRIQDKLPGWIRGSLTIGDGNGAGVREVEERLDTFFAGKSTI